MNQNTELLRAIFIAWAEGKTVQFHMKGTKDRWHDKLTLEEYIEDGLISFNVQSYDWRIKPEEEE